ncbi:MAG: hypothetical protein RMJ98_06470 [Myxococcales bacterium]|nr:hypothetical protein [Polyangiaceae bacterium]MDW8248929.1 hypothetical protein [Myxococcales bacterium]
MPSHFRPLPFLCLVVALSLSTLPGCDDHDDHDHDHGEHHHGDHHHGGADGHNHGGAGGHDHGTWGQASLEPDKLACAALSASPKALAAVNDSAQAADTKMVSGETYLIQRSSSSTSHVSFVNLTEHANWHLYFKEPKALVGISVGGTQEDVPESSPTQGCNAELPASYLLHLHKPGVYTLALAPGTQDLWAFLIEGEAGH